MTNLDHQFLIPGFSNQVPSNV